MNHVITLGDIVHWGLFGAFLVSLFITAVFWLYNLAASMSDAPSRGSPRWLLLASLAMPIIPFIAWWFT